MRVDVVTPDCKLTTALLVWSADRQPFLTVHQVQDSAGKPSILDGRLASQAEVLKLLRSLTNEREQGGAGVDSYLSPTILSVSPRLTWWRPASLAPMWFRGKDLERNGVAVQPGLVFQASEEGLKVFAVKSRTRPTPTSRLWQAPYPNVWAQGGVCLGNARRPKVVGATALTQAWEAAFWGSAFTHTNQQGKRALTSYPAGVHALWSALLDDHQGGKSGRFPNSALVPLAEGPCFLKDIL
jgi:PRTRC genetic system protein B